MLYILFFGLTLFSYSLCSSSNETELQSKQPSWVELECQPGSKYLFSDDLLIWEEARARCGLYNGWLVDIQDVHEQNCLMEYALTTDGIGDIAYWTDANDFEITGVWKHASSDTEVKFFGSKSITCYNEGKWGPGIGNAILFYTSSNHPYSGIWCNTPSTSAFHYICEAYI